MYDDHEPYDSYDEQENEPVYPQETYDSTYKQYYANTREPYAQESGPPDQPEIISTSQAVNITCTMASISVLLALFLCFADQRSRAVRRYAIQSVGFGAVHIGIGVACWLIDLLLGWVPYLGRWLHLMLIVIMIAVSILVFALRVVMMFHAYRGEAYTLPVFGESLRRFE